MTEESRVSPTPSEEAQMMDDTGDTGSGREAHAQKAAITCSGCTSRWTGLTRAHCAAKGCHRTFTSVSAFDAHRDASGCGDPALAGLVEREPNLWGPPAMTKQQIEDAWGAKR